VYKEQEELEVEVEHLRVILTVLEGTVAGLQLTIGHLMPLLHTLDEETKNKTLDELGRIVVNIHNLKPPDYTPAGLVDLWKQAMSAAMQNALKAVIKPEDS